MNNTEQPDNPYESPHFGGDKSPAREGFQFTLLYSLAILLTAGLVTLVHFTTPPMQQIFDDFDIALPVATRLALHPAALIIVLGLFAVTLAKEFIPQKRHHRWWINGLLCLLAIVLAVAYAFAVFIPLISLIQSLN